MSKVIKLKKGLDIKLKGEAENVVKNVEKCNLYAVKPTDFRLLTPKLAVKVGDQVKAGDVLFINKYRPEAYTLFLAGYATHGYRSHRYSYIHPSTESIQPE